MKVLLVNKFWYLRGGTERMVFLTKELLEKDGHQVEIFGMRHPQNIIENDFFVDCIDYDSKNLITKFKNGWKVIYNFEAKRKFAGLLRDFRPDIIHFHNIYHQLSFSLLDAAKKYHIPVVMTLHDYKLISPNYNLFHDGQICERATQGKYYRALFHNCLSGLSRSFLGMLEAYFVAWRGYKKMINLFISPSEFLRNKFIANKFLAEKIIILPNALYTNYFEFSEHDGEGVVYIGRLAEEKGVDNLLSVAKQLPEIVFKLVGTGPKEAELNKKVVQDKIANVQFLGYRQGEDLTAIIEQAKIIILPSLWYENCPLSIIEAAGKGRLVLASDLGGISGIKGMLPQEMLFDPYKPAVIAEKIKYWFSLNGVERLKVRQMLFNQIKAKYNSERYLSGLLHAYEAVKKEKH